MGKDLHDIDHLFRNAQKDFEEQPSDNVWDKITYKLDHNSLSAKKEDKLFFGLQRVLFLVFFVFAAFGLDKYELKSKTGLKEKIILMDNANQENNKEIVGERDATVSAPANTSVNIIDRQKNKYKLIEGEHSGEKRKNVLSGRTAPDKSLLSVASVSLLSKDKRFSGAQKKNTSPAVFRGAGMFEPAYSSIDRLLNTSPGIIPGKIQLAGKAVELPPLVNTRNRLSPGIRKNWALSVLISNDWGGYFINDEKLDRSGIPHSEHEEISGREHHEESFSASFFLSRYFSTKFLVKGGLMYSNTVIGINPQYIYAARDPNGALAYQYITSSGYDFVKPSFASPASIGDSLYSTEAKHKLTTVSLQIMPGYTFRKSKKLSITPATGVSIGYITRASLKTEVEDNLNSEIIFVDRLTGSKKFYLGFVADVSLAYRLTSKWSLNLVPSFRLNLTPVTTTDFIKTYPYAFSLGAGMSYLF
ncbi:MAG: DUF2715 domain-containing protein [Bacteroidetes bacterium]|nr:DUF2715 domain-containing protein [Bacteroidota bacterium]MBS1609215.1 DUF2715 domain-containing protein [Bacteroidota bacterium]